jgi:hypothetical protein
VRTALRAADFNDPDISFSDDGSPQALWTKISALHYHLNRWQHGEQRRLVAFYYQHLADFDKLSEDYTGLAVVARRVFHLLDTLQPMQSDPKLAEVRKELIDEFVARAARLEKEIDDLISRALLQGALTEKTRWEAQAAMGFVVNMAPRLFDHLLLYIILGALYITVLLLAHRPWPKLSGAIIATNYMGAILSAF